MSNPRDAVMERPDTDEVPVEESAEEQDAGSDDAGEEGGDAAGDDAGEEGGDDAG